MRLTQQQCVAIAGRVIPDSPCTCGSVTHRIDPQTRELAGMAGQFVAVSCTGCSCENFFAASALGLARPDANAN